MRSRATRRSLAIALATLLASGCSEAPGPGTEAPSVSREREPRPSPSPPDGAVSFPSDADGDPVNAAADTDGVGGDPLWDRSAGAGDADALAMDGDGRRVEEPVDEGAARDGEPPDAESDPASDAGDPSLGEGGADAEDTEEDLGHEGEDDAEADPTPWSPPSPTYEDVCPTGFPEGCLCDPTELPECCWGTYRAFSCDGRWREIEGSSCFGGERADTPQCPPPPCRADAPFPCRCRPGEETFTHCCYSPSGIESEGAVYLCVGIIDSWVQTRPPGFGCGSPPLSPAVVPLPTCPQPY
jgi:hypothetical protein